MAPEHIAHFGSRQAAPAAQRVNDGVRGGVTDTVAEEVGDVVVRVVHPKLVSEMLGHATVAITLDLYSHATPAMHREAATVLDTLQGVNSGVFRGTPDHQSEYEWR